MGEKDLGFIERKPVAKERRSRWINRESAISYVNNSVYRPKVNFIKRKQMNCHKNIIDGNGLQLYGLLHTYNDRLYIYHIYIHI